MGNKVLVEPLQVSSSESEPTGAVEVPPSGQQVSCHLLLFDLLCLARCPRCLRCVGGRLKAESEVLERRFLQVPANAQDPSQVTSAETAEEEEDETHSVNL